MERTLRALLLASSLAAVPALGEEAVADAFGPIIEWRQPSGFEVTPIHIGLLPDGNLYFGVEYNFFFFPGKDITAPGFLPEFFFVMRPTPLGEALPASVVVEPIPYKPPAFGLTIDRAANRLSLASLTCSGHAPMADGRVFFSGGPRANVDLSLYAQGKLEASLTIDGIADSLIYDAATGTWGDVPKMTINGPSTGEPLRWYPTVTRLGDGRMLVTGGYERAYPKTAYNPSVEIYDPSTNAWKAVSGLFETPPGIENPDYTHVFQTLVPGRAFVLGGSGEVMELDVDASPRWRLTGKYRPGAKAFIDSTTQRVFPLWESSSALLPLRLAEGWWGYANGSVINVGGAVDSRIAQYANVFDPALGDWGPAIALRGERHHPSTVILPDGRILVLAGWNDDPNPDKVVGYAEYIDPRKGFAVSRGTAYMPETRGYHTITALLPDGRVVVGGGNLRGDDGQERHDFRYYYPDYMARPRPAITSAPAAMRVASYATIAVPRGTAVGEVALMGIPAMTHSFDMNQRHVQLRTYGPVAGSCPTAATCEDIYLVQTPATAEVAPPGPYMLFVLDANRTPSIGKLLKLLPANGPASCSGANCRGRGSLD